MTISPANAAATLSAPPPKLKLTPQERRASIMLALLFAPRMLGLFLLTPVFAVAAASIPGGNDTFKVGLALGAYGLTQAVLQIPLGIASDRYGRRAVVAAGMALFVAGGAVCALASNIEWVIAGRVVQGLGAVSAAITAWVADATRPEVRTRAMAMVGGSIGLSFAAALVLSPLLTGQFGLSGLFWAITLLGFVCLLIAVWLVPAAPRSPAPIVQASMREVFTHAGLLRLNLGVFCLHFILMAVFMVAPGMLAERGGYQTAQLWQVYLPVILLSFVFMAPAVFVTETRRWHRGALLASVAGLVVVCAALSFSLNWWATVAWLVAFFVAFNVLEALQPSLVSRLAPPSYKGMALGLYNTAQALGVFAGAAAGGALVAGGYTHVFWLATGVALLWRVAAQGMAEVSTPDAPAGR
jgi:MFS family permease